MTWSLLVQLENRSDQVLIILEHRWEIHLVKLKLMRNFILVRLKFSRDNHMVRLELRRDQHLVRLVLRIVQNLVGLEVRLLRVQLRRGHHLGRLDLRKHQNLVRMEIMRVQHLIGLELRRDQDLIRLILRRDHNLIRLELRSQEFLVQLVGEKLRTRFQLNWRWLKNSSRKNFCDVWGLFVEWVKSCPPKSIWNKFSFLQTVFVCISQQWNNRVLGEWLASIGRIALPVPNLLFEFFLEWTEVREVKWLKFFKINTIIKLNLLTWRMCVIFGFRSQSWIFFSLHKAAASIEISWFASSIKIWLVLVCSSLWGACLNPKELGHTVIWWCIHYIRLKRSIHRTNQFLVSLSSANLLQCSMKKLCCHKSCWKCIIWT